jgi:diguanylate cyclase
MHACLGDQDKIGRYGGAEERSTLNIGAAMYRSDTSTSAMWIHLADEAMYKAKREGRNKLVFAG